MVRWKTSRSLTLVGTARTLQLLATFLDCRGSPLTSQLLADLLNSLKLLMCKPVPQLETKDLRGKVSWRWTIQGRRILEWIISG